MNKSVFLETHNLKNRATGLGTFNYELIKGLSQIDLKNLDLILNSKNPNDLMNEFGSNFKYHQYKNLSRYKIFSNRNKYDLWHSVNQNTKIEPFNPKKYLLTVHDVNFEEEETGENLAKSPGLLEPQGCGQHLGHDHRASQHRRCDQTTFHARNGDARRR